MNTNQLLYFATVGKYSNITRAAAELHISQPAITKSIHQLEEELGVILLNRSQNRVTLTYEGQVLLKRSQDLLLRMQALQDEMCDYGKLRRNTIKVGIPPAIGTLLLPGLDLAVREELGIEMDVFESGSQHCIQQVASGELDMAIVLLEERDETDLDCEILLETSFDFCTHRDSPFRGRTEVHPSELEQEKLILFYPGIMIHQLLKTYHLTPKFVLRSSQVSTIRNYIHCGLASTFQFPEAFRDDPAIISIPLQKKIPLYLAMVKRHGSLSCQGARKVYSLIQKRTLSGIL